jgi:hypothetical protein
LLAQLAFVASNDAAAARHDYEFPPVVPTPDELLAADYLEGLADALFDEARALGFVGGTDAAFEVRS